MLAGWRSTGKKASTLKYDLTLCPRMGKSRLPVGSPHHRPRRRRKGRDGSSVRELVVVVVVALYLASQ